MLRLFRVCCALLLVPALALADEPLRPFQASYKTTMGLMSATGERSLRPLRDGQWLFASRASVLGLAVTEQATIDLHGNRVRSLSYDFVNPLSSKRNLALRFDWPAHRLIDTRRDQSRELADGTFDRLSFQLQLQRDVCQAGDNFHEASYRLADANKFKTYRVELLGRETLKTRVGTLDTIKLRQYRPGKTGDALIWLAPQWDCLLVQLQNRDDDDNQVLKLISATVDGRAVTGAH